VFLKMAESSDVVVQNVRRVSSIGWASVTTRSRRAIENCLLLDRGYGSPGRRSTACLRSDYPGMAGVMTSQRTQGRPRAVKNILGDKSRR